jgi:hypothetical protein
LRSRRRVLSLLVVSTAIAMVGEEVLEVASVFS